MLKSFGVRNGRRWSLLLVVLTVVTLVAQWLLLTPEAQSLVATNSPGEPTRIVGTRFVDQAGKPVFLLGVNYEGPTDRAWQVWEESKFDSALINDNFAQTARAGLNTVRVFVQKPLRDNINANNWSKLDKVIELASNHKLKLLITFNDYDEPNLAREAELNRKIVAHYKGNSTVLGYDLKNEPQFGDVVTADYPAGVVAPLQDEGFIKSYGERMSNAEVIQWRQTAQGKAVIPSRFDERRAYFYANAYKLWLEFLNESGAWVVARSGKNTLDYIDSPDSDKWRVYLAALSGTLEKYIEVRQGAIRAADPNAITTIGWSNSILSKMKSNDRLSFVSLHRFVPAGVSGLNGTLNLLENLRGTFPARPIVLEEFGYSNATSNGAPVEPLVTANYETALWLSLYARGFAGGFKWMLTNFTLGFNPVQNNYGLLDNNTQPKPAYHALRGVTTAIISQGHQSSFNVQNLTPLGTQDIAYQFNTPTGFFTSAKTTSGGPVSFSQNTNAPFAAWWNANGPAELYVMATVEGQVTVNLDNVYPQRQRQQPVKLFAEGQLAQESVPGASLGFVARPGTLYRLQVPVMPSAFGRASALPGASYFNETGHNLSGRFRAYWQQYGGLAINGLPISEEFNENGLVVQYFERARFEYHPENAGSKYEVLLGHLGRRMTEGREGEGAFRRVGNPNQSGVTYYPETGHTLKGAFKKYWESKGGLAQFGFPITEEFAERNSTDGKTYTVQYYERARFEFHPENAGSPYEVLLGHLGWQLVRANGWLP